MPFYFPISNNFSPDESQRSAINLLKLRKQLRDEVPSRTMNDTLLLATWNLRDFDSNKFGHGPRLKESFFYIAEIISAFDLIALQEVNKDLSGLNIIMRILGPEWDYITTDGTEGASGNGERMTFIYDTRKVSFQKIAGEVVLPFNKTIGGQQFARTPFMVAFQSGWFRFNICTVHIYYGEDRGELLQRRIAEIDTIAAFLSKRADDEAANYIILGDFNIVSPEHQTMQSLKKHGFIIPEGLSPSNMLMDKYYDQIGFKSREGQVKFGGRAGVFNLYKTLFGGSERLAYYPLMKNRGQLECGPDGAAQDTEKNKDYYLGIWRTFQMSDHLPMWVELKIDFSDEYLQKIVTPSFDVEQTQHPLDFSMPELNNR